MSNWRPVSLSNTIAELYFSILGNRFGTWAASNERINTAQKGFIYVNGCCAHNFVVQAAIWMLNFLGGNALLRDQISPMPLGRYLMKPSPPFCSWAV